MYLYIYDSLTGQPEFARVMESIETRLTDLGISGDRERVTAVHSIRNCLRSLRANEPITLVAVGDDQTLTQLIADGANLPITFGFIPLREGELSRYLSLPLGLPACDTLSRRKIWSLRLGEVNNSFFLSVLRIMPAAARNVKRGSFFHAADPIPTFDAQINLDSRYDLRGTFQSLTIKNNSARDAEQNLSFHIVAAGAPQVPTTLRAARASIFAPPVVKAYSAGAGLAAAPLNISLSNTSIKLIAGRLKG